MICSKSKNLRFVLAFSPDLYVSFKSDVVIDHKSIHCTSFGDLTCIYYLSVSIFKDATVTPDFASSLFLFCLFSPPLIILMLTHLEQTFVMPKPNI